MLVVLNAPAITLPHVCFAPQDTTSFRTPTPTTCPCACPALATAKPARQTTHPTASLASATQLYSLQALQAHAKYATPTPTV